MFVPAPALETEVPHKKARPFELPESYHGSVFGSIADLLDPPIDLWWMDPNAWAAANIDGWDPAPYQAECLLHLATHHRVSERGPHGLGKSSMAAIAVLWFVDTRDRRGVDWKVVTTASVWRQLTHFLWPEIRKWAGKLKHRKFTKFELLTLEIKLKTGSAFAIASDEPENLEGAHADHILYVIDEGKNVPTPTWDAIEGALSTGEAYCLAISTPGKAEGRFYEIQTRKPGTEDWWVKHVTLQEAIDSGRINPAWAEQRKKLWGATSQTYLNRVLGEFATDDALTNVIPLTWVESANERWLELYARDRHTRTSLPRHPDPEVMFEQVYLRNIGVDVAYMGDDMTILAPLYSNDSIPYIESFSRIDTQNTAGKVAAKLKRARILADEAATAGLSRPPEAYATIDIIGVGTGVVDAVRVQGLAVDAFNGSEGSDKTDITRELGFINRRAEAWWKLREALDPAFHPTLALPPDDVLIGDLTAPTWSTTARGKVQIETKDQIKARLGRSPDKGDAVAQAVDGRSPQGPLTTLSFVSFDKTSAWGTT